jgi:hypothetical protein
MRGLVSGGVRNQVIFTLPPGYRPSTVQRCFAASSGEPNQFSRLDIYTDGRVDGFIGGVGGDGWISLSNVIFDTGTVTEWATGPEGPPGPQGPPGLGMSVQRKWGVGNFYRTLTSGEIPLTNGALDPTDREMVLIVTPEVDSWWEVTGFVGLVQKLDYAYHYAYFTMRISPGDYAGLGEVQAIHSQHSDVQTYGNYKITRIFQLVAGTTYTVAIGFITSGGSWQYYTDANRLSLEGKLWPQ